MTNSLSVLRNTPTSYQQGPYSRIEDYGLKERITSA